MPRRPHGGIVALPDIERDLLMQVASTYGGIGPNMMASRLCAANRLTLRGLLRRRMSGGQVAAYEVTWRGLEVAYEYEALLRAAACPRCPHEPAGGA